MKNSFVSISNTKRFLDGIDEAERRGASECCFVVTDGAPGLGKTSTAQWYAIQQSFPFLRAKRGWHGNWMMAELLDQLRLAPERGYERMYAQLLKGLGDRKAAAHRAGLPFVVIIDEADHIIRKSEIMELIRDFTDPLEITFVLVGMGKIRAGLSRFAQISSRQSASVEFHPLSLEDTRAIVDARSHCEVEDDLLHALHQASRGYAREVMEGIASIERHCRRNARPASLADMEGRTLMFDRATSQPILVRAS